MNRKNQNVRRMVDQILKITFQFLFVIYSCMGKAQTIEAFAFSQNKYNTDVWIEKVVIGNGKTEVKMQIKPVETDIEIFLYPPFSEQSIILRTFEKTYQLLDADSIPFYPEKIAVLLNETKSFSLFYDELPEDVTEIDIIERVEPFNSGFSFFNVRLTREKEKKKSLRFFNRLDFSNYFKNKSNLHPLEGFWKIEKEIITSFKKTKKQPQETKHSEMVAVVKEDGLLRAYYLDGEEYNIALKELDYYFILTSDMIKTTILVEVAKDRKKMKVFGLIDKSQLSLKKKERRKIRDVILRTFWEKE